MSFRASLRSELPLLVSILVSLAGCGGSEPPPKTADDTPQVTREHDEKPGMRTENEIGGLNEEKVDAAFKHSLPALEKCLDTGSERLEFLGGSVSFFLKVNGQGKADQAYVEHSTLGDSETENCMLSALRARTWPKPVGGNFGLARKSFDFDPPKDVRPPVEWDQEHAQKAVKKLEDKIDECKKGHSGAYEATVYVSTEGSVLAASVTPPNEAGVPAVDCLVETLRAATFPSPGSWPAKVTFTL
jgi:hypothetical protein